MDWVRPFYANQHAWLGTAGIDGAADADERGARLHRILPPPARVLELGAGRCETAVALARAGYRVVAVELIPEAAEAGRAAAAAELPPGVLDVHAADMYAIDLDRSFDVVAYWDGFGIGTDDDQRRLLRRIAGWLERDGAALIEVYTPWYWAEAAGHETDVGPARRRYGFDPVGCRMLDAWWTMDAPGTRVVQSLRCYAPADLRLLLEGTGLRLDLIEPGGGWDAGEGAWLPRVPLERAMSYEALLHRA